MGRGTSALGGFVVVLFVAIPMAWAQPAESRVGERGIAKEGAALEVDGEGPGGDQSDTFRVYRVEKVDGSRVRVKAEGSALAGWFKADVLIPLDKAVDYYSDEIRTHPDDASRYAQRGLVWWALLESDKAIADFNEALRLDPKYARAHSHRGLA